VSVQVERGTVVAYTDVSCPWSTLSLHRFYTARARLGLAEAVRVDHRLFLLEDLNSEPVSRRTVDAEIPVVGPLAPDLGFTPWQQEASEWPVTSLLANEAVHAAKAQSGEAAERLDMALRLALFRDSRCISMLHVVLDVAGGCDAVDVGQLRAALDDGRARGPMMADYRAHCGEVKGSPHYFLADGSDVSNPGMQLHWEGEPGAGYPVVDSDDESAYDDLVRRAAGR
jgi:predicted DsbA family dithiol-disulfide isomerase